MTIDIATKRRINDIPNSKFRIKEHTKNRKFQENNDHIIRNTAQSRNIESQSRITQGRKS